ncbi:hypothetical protein EIP75_18430 [Aquabacterium soli]|uniref:Uncharacterized protein n=1 Tax=Aquabacterium soli TaxID=2493092 RepID=A0A3R8S030_9BURK|nr:hypothetical protein [Aquabacterium soli]RRS02933.1 hypothetical protein EIP75_18430 [Aquabacterium soli]
MQLDLTLAGFTSPWSFRGSRTFANWAEGKPWVHEGSLCVLHTEEARISALLRPSISRFVHGINAGLSRLDICYVSCGAELGTPVQAMIHAFELDSSIPPFEALGRIEARIRDRSLLLVFHEGSAVHPDDWLQLVMLLEHFRKSTKTSALAAIVIDHRNVVDVQPACDFRFGHPSHSVLVEASSISNAEDLWPAYVHHRIAWEAGGSIAYALSLGHKIAECPPGNDEELERLLQEHAVLTLQEHSGKADLEEAHEIVGSLANFTSSRRQLLRSQLFQHHLLWRPPAMNSFQVVPWASRALLAHTSLPRKYVWGLRHQLVCAPLAGEIMALCLKFESQILVRLHGKRNRAVSAEALDGQDRFKRGGDRFIVYPAAFPARPVTPDDAWAFASLGQNLASSTDGSRPMYGNTRLLRNAIAHGHYVNWRHVDHARQLLESFDD